MVVKGLWNGNKDGFHAGGRDMEEYSIDSHRADLLIRPATTVLPPLRITVFDSGILVDGGVQPFSGVGTPLEHFQVGVSNPGNRVFVGFSIVELDTNARCIVIVRDDSGFSGSVQVGFHCFASLLGCFSFSTPAGFRGG